MFLYIKTNILRGYGIFKNDFAHPREPANGAISDSDVCLQFACCSGLQPHVLSVLQITAGPSWILELQERSSGHLPVLQLKHRHTQYSVKAVSSEFSLMKVPNFSFQMGKI